MQPRDAAQRCELLLALGSAQMKAGDVPQARSTFCKRHALPEAAGALALAYPRGVGVCTGVEVGKVDQALVTLLEDTLYVLGEADSAERACVLGTPGTRTLLRRDLDRTPCDAQPARRGDGAAVWRPDSTRGGLAHAAPGPLWPWRPPGAPGHHHGNAPVGRNDGRS